MEFWRLPVVSTTLLLFWIFDSTYGWSFKDIKLTYCDNKRVDNSSVLYSNQAMSSLECSALCSQDINCLSARYKKKDKICDCFSKGHRYFDSKCGCLEKDSNYDFIYKDYPCYFHMSLDTNGSCVCDDGFTGEECENPPRDCSDISATIPEIGFIYLYPDTCAAIPVLCTLDNLILFQLGGEYKPRHSWAEFKTMFSENDFFWWGNEQMHRITNQMYNYTLVIAEKRPFDIWSWRLFNHFYIEDETSNYALRYSVTNRFVEPPNSPSDNILTDGIQFHTFDHNDEEGCVATHNAAFWYDKNCTYPSPLLRLYPFDGRLENVTEITAVIVRESGDILTILFEQGGTPINFFVSNLTLT